MTKLEELSHVAELSQRLGPDSYLGTWLAECLPMLRDCMAQDFIPDSPAKMHNEAAIVRCDAINEAFKIREQTRQDLATQREEVKKEKALILADAQKQASRIRETAWSALRQATRVLEA